LAAALSARLLPRSCSWQPTATRLQIVLPVQHERNADGSRTSAVSDLRTYPRGDFFTLGD
jgi:hypothetical protein